MGYEYQLRFAHAGGGVVADLVRRFPFAQERRPRSGEFELRAAGPGEGMPDAEAHLTPYGLYFRDNGGAGKLLLGVLIGRLANEFGPVMVAELDEDLDGAEPGGLVEPGGQGEKCQIVGAGNTIVPAYLALLQKGYRVLREESFGATELWRAERRECTLIAEDPERLLGLAAMYEARRPEWMASDAEIEEFLGRFPHENG